LALPEQAAPPLRHKSYLASIWIVPLAVLLIVGLTLVWVTYEKYLQTHAAEYRLLESYARYADVQTGVALRQAERLLDKIATERLESIDVRNHRLFDAILASHRHDHSEFGVLFVADAHGKVIAASNLALVGRDVSGFDFFAAHRDPARPAAMHISRPAQVLPDVTAVTLSQLIAADDDGEFVGVVGATIDFNFFARALRINSEESASVTVIFNTYGDLLYRSADPEKFFGMNIANVSDVYRKHMREGTLVTRHFGPSANDGRPRLFVTRSIEDTGLSAILSRREDEVLADLKHNLLIHILIFVFTAGVMFFLARLAQRRQSQLLASTEALRIAKESAETANVAKSQFLAAASHDLRQPLHALSLMVSVLKHRDSSERNMQIIKPIEASTQALREMLDTLLDISKLDAGIIVPQKQVVRIDTLFERLANEFEMQVEVKHLTFRVRYTTAHVLTDPTLLMEILRNLLSNASHYTQHGGILLGCRVRREHLLIQVWDTGMGIPDGEQEKIFREYYQVSNAERDRHKGLGLGLSIVDRVAKLLEHRLRVCSRVGKGSMFEVAVPLATIPPSSIAPLDAPVVPASRATILVIDDAPMILQSMTLMLESLGYAVVTAESASEALDKIADHAPDLIVADYRLREGETGIAAIAQIRAFLGVPVPSILVTGDTLPERLREANDSGFQLLHKPTIPHELDMLIKQLLADAARH